MPLKMRSPDTASEGNRTSWASHVPLVSVAMTGEVEKVELTPIPVAVQFVNEVQEMEVKSREA